MSLAAQFLVGVSDVMSANSCDTVGTSTSFILLLAAGPSFKYRPVRGLCDDNIEGQGVD